MGIDITTDYIPVRPAAHYMCGGIKVDLNGQTSIERLYALGECSCTGLHGGNRLASNSLIEAVVYAETAAKNSLEHVDYYEFNEKVPEWNDEGTMTNEEKVLITQSVKEVKTYDCIAPGIDWTCYTRKLSDCSSAYAPPEISVNFVT